MPDPLTVNIAKSHFAHHYHQAVMHLQELAGALLVTAPSRQDFDHPVVGPALRRYLAGAGVDGAERVALINLVSDLTTGEFGGYQEVLAIHAEGSLEAEKLMIVRSHDPEPAIAFARSLLVPPSRATERGL